MSPFDPHFANPHYLWTLVVLPLLLIPVWRSRFAGTIRAGLSVAVCSCWLSVAAGLAGPHLVGYAYTEDYTTRSWEALLDDSGSMTRRWPEGSLKAVTDMEWTADGKYLFIRKESNAFEVFRDELATFARTRTVDTIGLTVFDDKPLHVTGSADPSASAAQKLPSLEPRSAGTNMPPVIEDAIARLKTRPANERVLLILTDGEDYDLASKPTVREALVKELSELGAHIYLVIPTFEGHFDESARHTAKAISDAGGLVFYADNRAELAKALATIGDLEKSKLEPRHIKVESDLSPLALLNALLWLAIGIAVLVWGVKTTPRSKKFLG